MILRRVQLFFDPLDAPVKYMPLCLSLILGLLTVPSYAEIISCPNISPASNPADFPLTGQTLEDFLPEGWEIVQNTAAVGEYNLEQTLTRSGITGGLGVIGKLGTNGKTYEQCIVLVLHKDDNVLRRLGAFAHIENSKDNLSQIMEFASYEFNDDKLIIDYSQAYSNTSDKRRRFEFSFINNAYQLTKYDDNSRIFVYKPRLESTTYYEGYDFINKTLETYSDGNIETDPCQDDENLPCPEAEKSVKPLVASTIPKIDLNQITDLREKEPFDSRTIKTLE